VLSQIAASLSLKATRHCTAFPLSIDGHLGYFHIVTNASMRRGWGCRYLCEVVTSFLLGLCPESDCWVSHMVVLFYTSATVTTPIFVLTNRVQVFPSHPCQKLSSHLFDKSLDTILFDGRVYIKYSFIQFCNCIEIENLLGAAQ
jgi:hypothetical protein